VKPIKLTLIFFFVIFCSNAQSHFEQFSLCMKEGDTLQQIQILTDWEKSNDNDPDLYTSYINHYYAKSKTIYLSTEEKPTTPESLQITDSLGNTKYLNERVSYDQKIIDKGIAKIDHGILKFPNRLDMRLGKIYVLKNVSRYDDFTQEIIKTIEFSNANKNQWTWSDDSPVPNAKNFFLRSVQDYVHHLYNTENDSLLDNMKMISETVLRFYPNHVESMSNIAVVYMIKNDTDKALSYLLLAQQMKPKDFVIIGNIAKAYELKNDKPNAIKYLELVKQHGDSEAIESATLKIAELKKK
jgi:tetratricopeptide (TPR) repeat protein